MEIEPTQTKPSDGLIVDASAEKSENDYYFNSYAHFSTFLVAGPCVSSPLLLTFDCSQIDRNLILS
jgi:hypothetical protein